jgi:hypothetical protein
MRHSVLILLPLLALSGCGSGGDGAGDNSQPGSERWARNLIGSEGSRNFERSDGSFDRADYRRVMVPGCAAGMRDGDSSIPAEAIDRYCACVVDRLLANSDDELRAMRSGSAAEQREFEEASRSCRPVLPGGAGDEPPPEEPAPPMDGAAPPTGIPTAAPDMAIIRNRAGRPLDCGPPSGRLVRFEAGGDYDIRPGRARCAAPVRPALFSVAPGRTYDLVPAGGGVAVRDVTPAGR